jgi:AraC-like DNA-binding protein
MEKLAINLPNTLFLIAAVYGVIFSFILFLKNYMPNNPKFWLGIFLLNFSDILLDAYTKAIDLDRILPFINWTYYRSISLIPFLLWVYILKLINGKFRWGIFEKTLITLVLIDVFFQIFSFIVSANHLTEWAKNNRYFCDNYLELLNVLASFSVLVKGILLVRIHQKKLANNFSYRTEKELAWLKELLIILLITTVLWAWIVPLSSLFTNWHISAYWIWMLQSIIIFYFAFKAHLQPDIFYSFALASSYEDNIQIIKKQANTEESLPITTQDTALILAIEQAMQVQKIYRQPKLSLQEMANELKISERVLSQAINSHYQCSFSDFINTHRINEVKERILRKDDEQFTILSIALDSGFNSKSSFNLMFKKIAGTTPQEFKKNHTIAGK